MITPGSESTPELARRANVACFASADAARLFVARELGSRGWVEEVPLYDASDSPESLLNSSSSSGVSL